MSEELKPCPFCNESKELSVKFLSMCTKWQYYVLCYNCGANGSECESEEEAIQAWNKRDRAKEGAE